MSKTNIQNLAEKFEDKNIVAVIEELPMKQYIEAQTLAGKMLKILENNIE